jgi:glycosyltransferase involved in cell wall biosynthesis
VRVLLFSRYSRLGPSSRVRFFQYLPYLRAQGVEVDVLPLLDDRYVAELYGRGQRSVAALLTGYLRRLIHLPRALRYDVVWLEGELLPWLPSWTEQLLARLGTRVVVDYDDAIFHRYDLHPRASVRALLASKIDRVMGAAALVVAGNEYLVERARRAGAARVELVPSVIDLHQYPRADRVRSDGPFTVGWIGSPSTSPYLQAVLPALEALAGEAAVRLVSIGSGPLPSRALPTEVRSWSEETESAQIQQFDVGIMPLADGPWERGKCGYKLIQYMASGVPVVASPVGANLQIVQHGVNGFLADSAGQWVEALHSLRGDPGLCRRMGEAGRARVESRYSVQVAAPMILSLLEGVAAEPVASPTVAVPAASRAGARYEVQ